jgi:hypothetical protein
MILVEGYELAQTITLPKGNVGKGQVLSAGVDPMGSATKRHREYPYRGSASSPAWPGWLPAVIGVVERGATFALACDGERRVLGGRAGQDRQPRQRQPAGLALRSVPAQDRLGSGCREPSTKAPFPS